MTRRDVAFAERLSVARRILATGTAPAPTHLADQMRVADVEASRQDGEAA